MEHTVYSKTQEKVTLGDVKFTVTHLIPKMSQEVKETSFEDKQKVLDAFVKVIKIANGNIEMTWNI